MTVSRDYPFDTDAAEEAAHHLLLALGFEVESNDAIRDTPARVAKAWRELLSGYEIDTASLVRPRFDAGAGSGGIVILRDVEFHSTCEHHLLPFSGRAHVAYIPSGNVVGLSKLARLVDAYARRLQIQERLGGQVADALMEHAGAAGAACMISALHSCMSCRGAKQSGARMVTSALRGAFLNDPVARAELTALLGTV